MSSNLFYKVGGSETNVVTLGDYDWTCWSPEVDEHFERYRVRYATSVDTWADFEQFEASLANSLGLGPLRFAAYPRGRARVISLSNSGGTLVNSQTGTSVESVFPESITPEDRFHWAGCFTVTFVKARRSALDGSNLFYLPGGDPADAVELGSFEDSVWTPLVDDGFERYRCVLLTSVNSWASYEAFETSLVTTLAVGPLRLVGYPRGGGRIVSFSNSGGTLLNSLTGTSVQSVFPESVQSGDHDNWDGKSTVTFVRAR